MAGVGRRIMERFIAFCVSVVLVVGALPTSAFGKPAGTPWKDWFVRGRLADDDAIRLEDDFFAAVNRDAILAYNADPFGPASPYEERENQIADQMAELIATDEKKAGGAANDHVTHDLACLRTLYQLYADWDARDKDGIEPVEAILDRLSDIRTLDELTDWYCSDDARLSMAWHADMESTSFTARGISLFVLSAYNEVDGEAAGSYAVKAYAPEYNLAAFCWSDSAVYTGGEVDVYQLQELRDAATNVDEAYLVLRSLGFSKRDAKDIAFDAALLEDHIESALEEKSTGEDAAAFVLDTESLTHAELKARCKGGFPLDRIIDAYGYADAAAYEIDGSSWLDAMNTLYVEENLDLFVSHALVSIALESSMLLDSDVYDAAQVADGDRYISDELREAAAEGSDGSDEVNYDEATDEQLALWERRDACSFAREAAPTSYAKVYAQHFYDEQTSRDVEAMVRSYLEHYEKMLAREDWISQKTRTAAIEKLRALRVKVGHPKAWPNTAGLEVRSRAEGGTLFSETRRVAANDLEQELYLLHHPDEGEYWYDCMDVNARYDQATNSVIVGMGILGGAYWPEDGSYEERLAGLGTTVGHEISHAFDDQGAYFDKNGGYEQWWTSGDLKAFQDRVERVQKCFGAIDPIGSGCYDGAEVSGEAIADMGGLKVTMLVAGERPSFDYDAFFRAYAKSWVSVMSLADATDLLANDTHPLDRDRVNVPVRELDEFFDTYDVTKGDGMWLDPAERVSVW